MLRLVRRVRGELREWCVCVLASSAFSAVHSKHDDLTPYSSSCVGKNLPSKRSETAVRGTTEMVRIRSTDNEKIGYPWHFQFSACSLPSFMLDSRH
jgi:hypothetical protein